MHTHTQTHFPRINIYFIFNNKIYNNTEEQQLRFDLFSFLTLLLLKIVYYLFWAGCVSECVDDVLIALTNGLFVDTFLS